MGIGLAYRSPLAVLVVAALPLAAYAASAARYLREPVWNIVPNSATYLANALLAWALAQLLKCTARRIDDLTARTARHERDLATAQERARHARLLHDRSLQTLEMLSRGPWITDPRLRDHVAAEASWLRGLVRGDPPTAPDGIAERVQELVRRHIRAGLAVTIPDRQLRQLADLDDRVPPLALEALLGAVDEALTNVAKHAGVTSAVLTVDLDGDAIRASVVDHGRGFDPASCAPNFGMAQSIHGRLAAVRGASVVHTRPGLGTQVDLTVPLAAVRETRGVTG
ncbi:sensor histidine kinase [Micromonospora sp. NPDC007230]|uniref:sensor histidine kinase n=1 Tax=Micromonospora sp. NPDC007230 TaxID=3364237 RepID=UPI003690EC86